MLTLLVVLLGENVDDSHVRAAEDVQRSSTNSTDAVLWNIHPLGPMTQTKKSRGKKACLCGVSRIQGVCAVCVDRSMVCRDEGGFLEIFPFDCRWNTPCGGDIRRGNGSPEPPKFCKWKTGGDLLSRLPASTAPPRWNGFTSMKVVAEGILASGRMAKWGFRLLAGVGRCQFQVAVASGRARARTVVALDIGLASSPGLAA